MSTVKWNIDGIDSLLNKIFEYAEISEFGDIAGDIAGNQADLLHNADCQVSEKESLVTGNQVSNQAGGIAGNQVSNQADLLHGAENQELEIIRLIDGNQVGTIVRGIARGIAENQIELLNQCQNANTKEKILSAIKLSSQRKNFVKYIKPLIDLNWLTMTIPNKPTRPTNNI